MFIGTVSTPYGMRGVSLNNLPRLGSIFFASARDAASSPAPFEEKNRLSVRSNWNCLLSDQSRLHCVCTFSIYDLLVDLVRDALHDDLGQHDVLTHAAPHQLDRLIHILRK